MDNLIQLANTYGPFGVIILAAFWYIVHKDKTHRDERKELTEVLTTQHEEALEVIKGNMTVVSELKTLISRGH